MKMEKDLRKHRLFNDDGTLTEAAKKIHQANQERKAQRAKRSRAGSYSKRRSYLSDLDNIQRGDTDED